METEAVVMKAIPGHRTRHSVAEEAAVPESRPLSAAHYTPQPSYSSFLSGLNDCSINAVSEDGLSINSLF